MPNAPSRQISRPTVGGRLTPNQGAETINSSNTGLQPKAQGVYASQVVEISPSLYEETIKTSSGPVTVQFQRQGNSLNPYAIATNATTTQSLNEQSGLFTVQGNATYNYAISGKNLVPNLVSETGTISYNGTPIATLGPSGPQAIKGAIVSQQVSGGGYANLGTINYTPIVTGSSVGLAFSSFTPAVVSVTSKQNNVGTTTNYVTSFNQATGQITISGQSGPFQGSLVSVPTSLNNAISVTSTSAANLPVKLQGYTGNIVTNAANGGEPILYIGGQSGGPGSTFTLTSAGFAFGTGYPVSETYRFIGTKNNIGQFTSFELVPVSGNILVSSGTAISAGGRPTLKSVLLAKESTEVTSPGVIYNVGTQLAANAGIKVNFGTPLSSNTQSPKGIKTLGATDMTILNSQLVTLPFGTTSSPFGVQFKSVPYATAKSNPAYFSTIINVGKDLTITSQSNQVFGFPSLQGPNALNIALVEGSAVSVAIFIPQFAAEELILPVLGITATSFAGAAITGAIAGGIGNPIFLEASTFTTTGHIVTNPITLLESSGEGAIEAGGIAIISRGISGAVLNYIYPYEASRIVSITGLGNEQAAEISNIGTEGLQVTERQGVTQADVEAVFKNRFTGNIKTVNYKLGVNIVTLIPNEGEEGYGLGIGRNAKGVQLISGEESVPFKSGKTSVVITSPYKTTLPILVSPAVEGEVTGGLPKVTYSSFIGTQAGKVSITTEGNKNLYNINLDFTQNPDVFGNFKSSPVTATQNGFEVPGTASIGKGTAIVGGNTGSIKFAGFSFNFQDITEGSQEGLGEAGLVPTGEGSEGPKGPPAKTAKAPTPFESELSKSVVQASAPKTITPSSQQSGISLAIGRSGQAVSQREIFEPSRTIFGNPPVSRQTFPGVSEVGIRNVRSSGENQQIGRQAGGTATIQVPRFSERFQRGTISGLGSRSLSENITKNSRVQIGKSRSEYIKQRIPVTDNPFKNLTAQRIPQLNIPKITQSNPTATAQKSKEVQTQKPNELTPRNPSETPGIGFGPSIAFSGAVPGSVKLLSKPKTTKVLYSRPGRNLGPITDITHADLEITARSRKEYEISSRIGLSRPLPYRGRKR